MRLTKAIREQIISAALDHKFKASIADAKTLLQRAAELLYNARLSAYHHLTRQELLDQVKRARDEWSKLPDGCRGWSLVDYRATMRIDSTRVDLIDQLPDFDGAGKPLEDDPLEVERNAFDALKALRDLNEARDNLKIELESTLSAFTTVAKLIKDWPEIEQFVPKAATTAGVPMIPVGALNNKLGI